MDIAEVVVLIVSVLEQNGNPSQNDMLNPVPPTQQYVAVVPWTTMAPGQLLTVTPLMTSVMPAWLVGWSRLVIQFVRL